MVQVPQNGVANKPQWDKDVHGQSVLEELRLDSALVNLMTGLGTSKDPRTHATVQSTVNLTEQQVDDLVKDYWQVWKYVSELPSEAVRKWIRLVIEQTDERAGEAEAKQVLRLLKKVKAKKKIKQALTWERQYGGSMIVMGVNDARDPMEPLDLDRVRAGTTELRFLDVYSKRRILAPTLSDVESDPTNPNYGRPRFFRYMNKVSGQTMTVHHSRCLVFWGWTPHERERDYEFGISMVNNFWNSLRDHLQTWGSAIAASGRISQRVVKQAGLMNMLTGNAAQRSAVQTRWAEIALIQSVFNIFLLDNEDSFETQTISLSGISDLIEKSREDLAAATGLSVQRFYGLQQQGLSNNDESGSERDDAVIAEYQRDNLTEPIERLVDIAAATLGIEADMFSAEFVPLREETPGAKSERRKTDAETAKVHFEIGAVDSDVVKQTLKAEAEPVYQFAEDDEDKTPKPEPDDGTGADGEDAARDKILRTITEVAEAVASGAVSREGAIASLVFALGVSSEEAAQLIGPPGFKKREEPRPALLVPNPGSGGPPKPPKPPAPES